MFFLNKSGSNKIKKHPLMSNQKHLFFLEDVSVQFGAIKALRNIHLKIEKGEIVFITGASGAGKTSLLKVLAGQLNPTTGTAYQPKKTFFISQIFQDLRLLERKTCEANLLSAFDRRIYATKSEFLQDMNELCKILGIKDRLGLKVKDANGGLKQKVAFVRALLCRPEVILCDEPTASLDSENAQRIYDVLNLYNTKRGLTVIWASHNRELVQRFSGRIVHLDKGKLIYSGHACFI